MKRFPKVLQDLMAEHQMTQSALATLSALEQVKISRLLRGVTRVDQEDLNLLFGAFTGQEDQLRLVRAHIQDEIPEIAFKTLEIHPPLTTLKDSPSQFANLPRRAQDAVQYLVREYSDVPSIADVFVDFASALGWEPQLNLHQLAKDIEREEAQKLSSSAAPALKAQPATGAPSPGAPTTKQVSSKRPKKGSRPSTRYPAHEE